MTALDISELKCRIKFLDLLQKETGIKAEILKLKHAFALDAFTQKIIRKELETR